MPTTARNLRPALAGPFPLKEPAMQIDIKHHLTHAILFTCYLPDSWGSELGRARALEQAAKGGLDLSGADFYGFDLRGANLRGLYAPGAWFVNADLTGADLRGAVLTGAQFASARLLGANLRGARAPYVSFRDANLTHACVELCDFEGATFKGAILAGLKQGGTTGLLRT